MTPIRGLYAVIAAAERGGAVFWERRIDDLEAELPLVRAPMLRYALERRLDHARDELAHCVAEADRYDELSEAA